MKLELLLTAMNINKEDLDKMNITSKCTVINYSEKESDLKYKNFEIHSFNHLGVSWAKNKGLEYLTEDIILLCDDDVVYNDNYEKLVLEEFKNNPKADVIFFNLDSPGRPHRLLKKRKRMHIYNSLNYATYNIAFRRNSIKDIKFNELFGPGAKYNNGTDTMFITDIYKNKLKVYSSPYNLGKVNTVSSTWFKGYTETFFFNKGALFTAVNPCIRHILMLQYLIRHPEVLKDYNIIKAYSFMLKGSKEYLNDIRSN